jgi:hypothetical protein
LPWCCDSVNIADLSQQYVEHALKQGKSDMINFTNKRLRDEEQELGRNYQVMAKDRERAKLKRTVPMPLTRNEKRQLRDGTKVAEQTVARARRRGQLTSRSGLQLGKRLAKSTPALQVIVQRIQAQRALTATPGSPNRLSPSAMAASTVALQKLGFRPLLRWKGLRPPLHLLGGAGVRLVLGVLGGAGVPHRAGAGAGGVEAGVGRGLQQQGIFRLERANKKQRQTFRTV